VPGPSLFNFTRNFTIGRLPNLFMGISATTLEYVI